MPFNPIHPLRRLFPALIVVALLLGVLPVGFAPNVAFAQGATTPPCTLMYAIQNGDTLSSLAGRFGTTVNYLYSINPVLRNQSYIFPGLVLCMSTDPNVMLPGFPGLPPTGAAPGINVVRVVPGQTVTLAGTDFVANTPYVVQMYRYGVANPPVYRVADFIGTAGGEFLQTLNIPPQLSNNYRILIRVLTTSGEVVASTVFLNNSNVGEPVANCTRYYTVQGGDTLSSISRQFNVSVQQLLVLNNLVDMNLIFSGQRLCISTQPVNQPGGQGRASLQVLSVNPDQAVTVGGLNFPRLVEIIVDMGVTDSNGNNAGSFVNIGRFTLDQNDDGNFMKTLRIPQALRGQPNLVIRMSRADNGQFLQANFRNVSTNGNTTPQSFPLANGITLPNLGDLVNQANQLLSKSSGLRVGAITLRKGRRVNLNQGSAGVYSDSAADDNALLTAVPVDPNLVPAQNLVFTQPLLLVTESNANGQVVTDVNGKMYVYFDVTDQTRKQYEMSQMDVYYFSPQDNAWKMCGIQVPVNEQGPALERLACQIESFGLYGVAIRP